MPIPVSYAQANFIYTGNAVPNGAQWTLGLDISASAGTPALVAADLETEYIASGIAANLSNDANLTSILVKFGPDATGPSAIEAANVLATGGTGGVPNTAFLVRKDTALGGKAGRGRMFLPSVPEASVLQSGVLNSGVVTALQADMDSFFAGLASQGLVPVLLHGDSSPLTTPTPITGFSVQSVVATQRRRLRP